MNQLLKRYLWLLGTLVCTAFGAFITQTVQAQANSVTLSAEPSSFPIEVGKEVVVTISYEVTQSTRLYYYPPDGFAIVDNNDAISESDNNPPSNLNGPGRIVWEIEDGQGSKTVRLSVTIGLTPQEYSHGVKLENDSEAKIELLTLLAPELVQTPSTSTSTSMPSPTSTSTSTPTPTATSTSTSSPTPTATSTSTSSPTPTATSTSTSTPTPNSAPTFTPSSTLVSNEDDENNNKRSNWLLIGLGGFGVLLLLGIGIYFLTRPWKRAKPTPPMPVTPGTTGMMPPPGTSPATRPAPPPLAFQPYLRSSDGRSFAITSFPFTIGRGENNSLVIDESFPQWQSVSRTHARIVQHAQGFVIEDQGSQNRLRVQGRLTERNLLRNGWQVRIGGVEFTFHDGSNASGGVA